MAGWPFEEASGLMEENYMLVACVRRGGGGVIYRTKRLVVLFVSLYCSPGLVARLSKWDYIVHWYMYYTRIEALFYWPNSKFWNLQTFPFTHMVRSGEVVHAWVMRGHSFKPRSRVNLSRFIWRCLCVPQVPGSVKNLKMDGLYTLSYIITVIYYTLCHIKRNYRDTHENAKALPRN